MTSKLAQKAGLKLFEKHIAQYQPVDPLYETYTDKRGKERRRKRELPPGLSKRDAAILKKVKKRAHYLDKGFSICGLRFGWTFVIGLIPGAGDVADASLNYFLVVRKAKQADLPDWLVRRMLFNNAVSAGVGFIPLVGDVILAQYKANSRNAALLEEFLRLRGAELLAGGSDSATAAVVRPGAGAAPGERITKPGGKDAIPERHVPVDERAVTTPGGTQVPIPGALPDSKGTAPAASGSGRGWFRRKSAGASAAPTATAAATSTGTQGRFVERV